MNAFSKRLFACIALIFLGFAAISFEFKNLIFFVIFASIIVASCFILSKFRKKRKNLRLVCVLLILAAFLGILCPNILKLKNNYLSEKYSGEHKISGYVAEVSSNYSFMCEYVVRVEKIDDKKASFDMVLVSDYQCELSHGDFFEFKGEILSLGNYRDLTYLKNKNEYDYPLICSIDEQIEINYLDDEFRLSLMLSNLNSKISSNLKAILGKDSGSLASALLLGNRELLSDDTLRDFKRAGVYHMLALSGLHVAILIGIFDWLLKKLFMPRTIRVCVLTILSLFYVALTGFALSACRSMLMLWVMYLALTLGKRRDAMTALFLAVSVIVLINPSAVLDIGLQLSFLSTFGVISATIISDKIKWFKKNNDKSGVGAIFFTLIRKLALINIASICVFIATLPILIIYFGEVSLATFISNIFMGVVCEMFMIFSFVALLLSFSPVLRFPFAELASRIGEIMTNIVSFIADMDGVMLSLLYPGTKILVFGLCLSFLILFAIRIGRKWMIFAPCVLFAVLMSINIAIYGASRQEFVRTEYLKGDNLILSSANEVYICDMSDGSYGALYESIQIAKENCFTEIDGIILTHYHSKHVVSLERLAKNYKIHNVILPKPQSAQESVIMRSIIRVLSDLEVETYIYENNRELDIMSGKLAISPRAYMAGYSHPGVAISFAYGKERLTLLSKSYFDTYLATNEEFKGYINESEYLIFGDDGRDAQNKFDIFSNLQNGCEISFSSFDLMNKTNFEEHLDDYKVYFDVEYKKYDLK